MVKHLYHKESAFYQRNSHGPLQKYLFLESVNVWRFHLFHVRDAAGIVVQIFLLTKRRTQFTPDEDVKLRELAIASLNIDWIAIASQMQNQTPVNAKIAGRTTWPLISLPRPEPPPTMISFFTSISS
jgi:hypothetical protein